MALCAHNQPKEQSNWAALPLPHPAEQIKSKSISPFSKKKLNLICVAHAVRRYIGPLSRGETKPKSFDWFHSIKQIKDSFNFTSSNQIDCCLRYHRGSWCQYNNYCYNIFSIHSTSETKWKEKIKWNEMKLFFSWMEWSLLSLSSLPLQLNSKNSN